MSNKDAIKKGSTKAALQYVVDGALLGCADGSTVKAFMALLAQSLLAQYGIASGVQ